MRLTPAQIDTIKSTAHAVLGEGAQVTLLGSRVDDDKKGGDVDLMVEVDPAVAEPALMAARVASRIEYIEDLAILASALQTGYQHVATLVAACQSMITQATRLMERPQA